MSTRSELAAEAGRLDADDPLAAYRDRYDLPAGMTYLDGNSLGAPARGIAGAVQHAITREWGERLIRSWSETWWTAPIRVGERIAPLVGAAPGQVVVADSTSVDVFKLLVGAARLRPERRTVVVDAATFPTDGYVATAAAELLGLRVRPADPDRPAELVDADTAVVLLNHVDYRTGRLADLPALTGRIHAAGAMALWDLSHSVGVVPIALDAAGADLAVGCTYKFLSGGPGAPAFSYVRRDLQDGFRSPLTGWCGHRDPFAMEPDYAPAAGIGRLRAGTPDVLSLVALESALTVWESVTIEEVRRKSGSLTDYFLRCVDALLPRDAVSVITPRHSARRGGQISLRCSNAEEIMSRLIGAGVIGDFRPPDLLRFGFAPLYTGHADALAAVDGLASVL
ncbi:MAG: kynureninase [Mycobacteriales bacterium]